MVKEYDKAPDWFPERDYSYLGKLDAAGWLHELRRCVHLASEATKREAAEPTFEDEWPDLFAAGLIPCTPGARPIEVVDKVNSESLGSVKKHMLFLQVWLPASDADILTAFKKALRGAREQYPCMVKKPGQKALNGGIGETEFRRWRTHKIVEISDLLDRASRERRKVLNADLGRWLFEGRKNPDQVVTNALKERERAFTLVHALLAYVNSK